MGRIAPSPFPRADWRCATARTAIPDTWKDRKEGPLREPLRLFGINFCATHVLPHYLQQSFRFDDVGTFRRANRYGLETGS